MIKKLIDKHPILAVILLMLLTLSPVMALRDYSPSNELRYISIVDEALEQGHVLVFTNQGQDYADKPPFYFWLMMLCKVLFGGYFMYALSMLSFIPACVIIAVMDKWLRTAHQGHSCTRTTTDVYRVGGAGSQRLECDCVIFRHNLSFTYPAQTRLGFTEFATRLLSLPKQKSP